jgi:adenylate cyclase
MPNSFSLKSLFSRERRAALLFLFLCCLSALCVYLIAGLKPFRLIELKMLDYRFLLRGKTDISRDIVLVSIGEKDIEILGRWPWPRKYHSDLIQILNMYGAKVVGYDILFSEPDKEDQESDRCLASTVAESGNVCFPMAFGKGGAKGAHLLPIPQLRQACAGTGFVNVFPDEDGIIRRTPLRVSGRSVFGLELARRFLGVKEGGIRLLPEKAVILTLPGGEKVSIPVDENNRMMVNHAGLTTDWPWLHFVQIIMAFMEDQKKGKPSIDLRFLKDKIVLVGSTHTGMPDIVETPFGKSSYGVELHASLINSILGRNFIRPLPSWIDFLVYLFVVLGTAVILHGFPPLKGGIFSVAILLTLVLFAYVLFSKFHIWLKVVKPVFGLGAVYLTGVLYHLMTVQRKERQVRRAFRHYVSPAVVSELIKEPERLRLGGETKEVTILFSDIREFTSFSEEVDPDLVGEMLNEYFSSMTESIFAHGGTLDKFIGDAIMALYGAPLELPNHPLSACLSALSMLSNLQSLHARWKGEDRIPFAIGIGVNTGMVKVGNFGSQERFDYTAIGPNVNIASRLEGLTKTYGVDIVISAATREKVRDEMVCRPLDVVTVRGSKRPIKIFELLGIRGKLPHGVEDKALGFEKALELYYARQWKEAQEYFSELLNRFPDDRPAQIYRDRAGQLIKKPAPAEWNRVFFNKGE